MPVLAPLRVGFAGTPPFAAIALARMLGAGFDVELVLTQPDRPQGRGLKQVPSAVKALAQERGLDLWQPASLKSGSFPPQFQGLALDVLIVAAYGLILPLAVLQWPTHGCINIHASLLPRWRGAAPIQRALLAGDPESGVSIMQMDEGLDTGPVIATRAISIAPRETTGTLTARLADAGAEAIVQTLELLRAGRALSALPQPSEGATYAAKIQRDDAIVDWSEDAQSLDRRVRACDPVPGATASLAGEPVKIWSAEATARAFGAPGTILSADSRGLLVACGAGALLVRELQRPGGKRMSAAAYLAGRPPGWPSLPHSNGTGD